MDKILQQKVHAGTLTGDEVGLLMLRDLLVVYENAQECKRLPHFSQADMSVLINALTLPKDIRRYNEYRYIHDFALRQPAIFESAKNAAELYYWRLFHILDTLLSAEKENKALQHAAIIMTPAQRLATPDCPRPVAILEAPAPEFCDLLGHYMPSIPGRAMYMAEAVLAQEAQIRQYGQELLRNLRECYVRKAGLQLVGEMCGLPEITRLLPEMSTHDIDVLNNKIHRLSGIITRYGALPNEFPEQDIRIRLERLFQPIDTDELPPEPEMVALAGKGISFETVQGNTEAMFAIMRQRSHSLAFHRYLS